MNDQEYIRDKFEQDGLPVPDSLSEERIRQMLRSETAKAGARADGAGSRPAANTNGPRPGSRRWLRPLIAAAACVCLALGIIPLVRALSPGGSDTLTADATGLACFSNEAQLDRTVMEMLESGERQPDLVTGNAVMEDADEAPMAPDAGLGMMPDAAAEDPGAAADANSTAKSGASAHSDTYTQEEGVDEADIVKTDGDCIYYVSRTENQVIIARAKNGKAKRLSEVKPAGNFVQDIYVRGDRLIVITSDQVQQTGLLNKDEYRESTRITVYDISDRTAPAASQEYAQTGGLISSRMIGDQVCLVTNDRIYTYRKGHNVPLISRGEETAPLPVSCIRVFPEAASPSYTVIGMMDTSTGRTDEDSIKTSAVMGSSGEIYCSGANLYITSVIYSRPKAGQSPSSGSGGVEDFTVSIPEDYPEPQTQILKVSLSGSKVKFLRSATVDGVIKDQFSMDETKGTFRIATTAGMDGRDVNHLFILNEKMKEIGSVRDFAPDEHIEAVRYLNDMAYVITYRQTDPLFVIDLRDPSAPVIKGHVKISGFSTLLHPADPKHLLGLGYSTRETGSGEATDGMKLALFDTSDPAAPTVADSLSIPGMSSEVQYNHKALMVSPDGTFYAFPFQWWDPEMPVTIEDDFVSFDDSAAAEGSDAADEDAGAEGGPNAPDEDAGAEESDPYPEHGILIFSAEDGKLKIQKVLESKETVFRCLMIGDWIYGICADDSIEGFRIGN